MIEPIVEPTIRRGDAADAARLAAFAGRVFIESYAAENDAHGLEAYVAEHYRPDVQARELIDPMLVTLLAEAGHRLAAFAQVRRGTEKPATVDAAAAIELWRIYVDAPWHGTGLASRLLRAVAETARDLGGDALWLSVWERNPRAIRFYEKSGLWAVGRADFRIGGEVQNDFVMAAPIARLLA